MAVITLNLAAGVRGTKALRQTTVAAQEDTWNVTVPALLNDKSWTLRLFASTAPALYHSVAGQVVADGAPIAITGSFDIPLLKSGLNTFFIAGTGAGGTIDAVLL